MSRDEGIRSYGPGKFYTILDSHIYVVTLEGFTDEEASYGEGQGWYGLVWIDADTIKFVRDVAAEENDKLTREEEEQLEDSAAVIFFERSDGIVEASWYDNQEDAQKDWDEIEADVSGDDDPFNEFEMSEGYVIEDARGGGYAVVHGARHFGDFESWDDALEAINEDRERSQFFGNIYYVNERGNIDLLDADGNIIESRV